VFLVAPITGRMIVAIVLTLAAVVWIQLSHKASSVIGNRSAAPSTTDNRGPTTPLPDSEAA